MAVLRRTVAGAGLVVAMCVLAGCGGAAGSGGDTPVPVTTVVQPAEPTDTTAAAPTQDRAAAAGGDACDLLTDEQVHAVSGRTPTSKKGATIDPDPGEVDCYWSEGGKSVLSLRTYSAPIDIEAKYTELKSGLFYDEKAASPGVGEDSFYRLAGYAQTATVVFRQGATVYSLTLGNPNEKQVSIPQEQAGRAKLVETARQVLANVH